jgi:hypothetical protein
LFFGERVATDGLVSQDPTSTRAGWKVTISVPQPNGTRAEHVWVVATATEFDAREKLLLFDVPADVVVAPLSSEEVAELGLAPDELRRIA